MLGKVPGEKNFKNLDKNVPPGIPVLDQIHVSYITIQWVGMI